MYLVENQFLGNASGDSNNIVLNTNASVLATLGNVFPSGSILLDSGPRALTAVSSLVAVPTVLSSFSLALNGNYTLSNPTTLYADWRARLEVVQGGSFTLSYDTAYKTAGGITITTGAGKVDWLELWSPDGVSVLVTAIKQGF
jgi:hypothetical protein